MLWDATSPFSKERVSIGMQAFGPDGQFLADVCFTDNAEESPTYLSGGVGPYFRGNFRFGAGGTLAWYDNIRTRSGRPIDDFEEDRTDAYQVMAGTGAEFVRQTDVVLEGNWALEAFDETGDGGNNDAYLSFPGDGLPYHPTAGDVIRMGLSYNHDEQSPGLVFGAQGTSVNTAGTEAINPQGPFEDSGASCYVATTDSRKADSSGHNRFRLRKFRNGVKELDLESGVDFDGFVGDWITVEIQWGDSELC